MAPGDEIDRPPMASTWHVPGYTALEGIAVDRAGALVLATQDLSGRRVVLRVLTPALARDAGYMRRLRARMPVLSSLRADHLVGAVALIEQPPTIVEEAVEGRTLTEVIDRSGPLPPAAGFVLLDACLEALAVLHDAGLTHDDVRPGSVIVDRDGHVWLRDGCVPVPPLHAGWNAGTPQYMAPELWAGRPHSVATDLYAAAAVFFEALSGRPPYANADLAGLRRAHESLPVPDSMLPAATRALVTQGLAKDPEARPADAARFRQDLATAAGAFLEDAWRETGRAWLTAAARRDRPEPVLPPLAPDTPGPVVVEPSDLAAAGGLESRWRDPRLLAGLAIAALLLVVVAVVAASALSGPTSRIGAGGSQDITPIPSSNGPLFTTAPTGSAPPSTSASASISPSPTTATTPVPTSTATVSLAPASSSPGPSPTACVILCTPSP